MHMEGEVVLASCGGRSLHWDASHSCCVLFEGELVGEGRDAPELRLLELYRERKEGFVETLNGTFAAVIWDMACKRLMVANDRFGLHPLYKAFVDGRHIWASSPKAMLANPAFPAHLNPAGLADFLGLNLFQADDTLVRGVSEITPGTFTVCEPDGMRTLRYWDFVLSEEENGRSARSYVDGAVDVLRASADRRQAHGETSGFLLSGGTSSRVALGALDRSRLVGLAFGAPNSSEAAFAWQVAETAGIPFRFHALGPERLKADAPRGIELSPEPLSCIQFDGLGAWGMNDTDATVIVTGCGGAAVFGQPARPREWANEFTAERHFEALRIFSDEDLSQLLQPEWYREVEGAAVHRFRDDLARCPSRHGIHRLDYWALRQWTRRLDSRLAHLFPDGTRIRPLFLDNEVVDFARALPPSLRWGEKSVYRRALLKIAPELASLPATTTGGLPLSYGLRRLRYHHRLAAWRQRFSRLSAGTPVASRPLGAAPDYASWLRGELRDWMTELLLEPRTLDRGLWRREGLSALITDCLDGGERAGSAARKLFTLISLELWCRRYFDTAGAAVLPSDHSEAR
ncbi:Asparagine synthetase B (glutamine-hydrolyzing) [Thiohalomonas denitrificans]|uniref:asparagine synthase (glutamine-hydrolyzing) n=2 Tax=Thiohalomonas denitrificans TaxID=415747 RepID=A0A1G5PZJ1_9GAMM|nr:Asparagine synthetase B (glutamine-hydrolyzing) [Thiohalomonas denitrificans]